MDVLALFFRAAKVHRKRSSQLDYKKSKVPYKPP